MLFLLQNFVRYIYQTYCRRHFDECHYIKVFDKKMMKEILGFSSWNMFGNGASVIKNHGGNLILNLFFGPSVNAARGLANHVHNAVQGLATNFLMALTPQITQSYAKKDYDYMLVLMNKGARFSYYLLLVICLPIIVNADYALHIWLKTVPDYTAPFVQLSLIVSMLYGITRPLVTGQNATGNVKVFQLTIGIIELLNIPISYIVLSFGASPEYVLVIAVALELLSVLLRIALLPKTIPSFSPKMFLRDVLLNCSCVTLMAIIAPLLLLYLAENSFFSFLINLLVCLISTFIAIYALGLKPSERIWFKKRIAKVRQKIS